MVSFSIRRPSPAPCVGLADARKLRPQGHRAGEWKTGRVHWRGPDAGFLQRHQTGNASRQRILAALKRAASVFPVWNRGRRLSARPQSTSLDPVSSLANAVLGANVLFGPVFFWPPIHHAERAFRPPFPLDDAGSMAARGPKIPLRTASQPRITPPRLNCAASPNGRFASTHHV